MRRIQIGLVTTTLAALMMIGCQQEPDVANHRDSQNAGDTNSDFVSPAGPDGPRSTRTTPTVDDLPDPIDFSRNGGVSKLVAVPTVIDTRKWKSQIYTPPESRQSRFTSDKESEEEGIPERPFMAGPESDLVVGGISDGAPIVHRSSFPGIQEGRWDPPDPTIAVGPNHIVETVNMRIAFFAKDGTLELQQQLDDTGNPGFFEDIGGGDFTFDPKCFYDQHSGRFVVLALEHYGDTDESWITIAVSDDSDPHGVWYKYRTWSLVNYQNATYWADYPGLGFDANGFYVTSNLFLEAGTGPGFGGVIFRAFDKTPMLSGQPVTFNSLHDPVAATTQCCQHFGNNPVPYFITKWGGNFYRLDAMNDPFGNPSITSTFINAPAEPAAPQITSPTGALGSVNAVMNACWRDGSLYMCRTIGSFDGNRAIIRWHEIETGNWPSSGSPFLRQAGNVDLDGSSHAFYPAIYTNSLQSTGLVFASSSSSDNPSVMATGRLDVDSNGRMRPPVQLVTSPISNSGRWGDYFDIAVDPVDDRTFWMVGEYQTANGWVTSIDSFTLPEPTAVEATAMTVVEGTAVSGVVDDLVGSDNVKVHLRSLTGRITQFEIESTANSPNPSSIAFKIESSVRASAADATQTVEFFNYDISDWEVVDSRPAKVIIDNFLDEISEFEAGGDLSRFVEPGTNRIEARISFTRPALTRRLASFVDEAFWIIGD